MTGSRVAARVRARRRKISSFMPATYAARRDRRSRPSRRHRPGRAGRARRPHRRANSSTRPSNASSASTALLNAVIHRRFERARAEAPAARGPFAGVPFLVKDAVCHTAGDPYHAGMQALKDAGWVEPNDTWLAARFRAAGFVFVGKTNTPELATSITTEPVAYGATHNPWDDTRSTGGSSGGSAAAVAAGLVPVAHGNDMGGSIRFPASMCGIVGLKPTRARTTLGPDFGEYWGPLTHEFVLDPDRFATPRPCSTRSRAPRPATRTPHRRRAGRTGTRSARPSGDCASASAPQTPDGDASGADVVAAVEATARLLADLGHDVDAADIPALDASYNDGVRHRARRPRSRATSTRWSARLGRDITNELEPLNRFFAAMGHADLRRRLRRRHRSSCRPGRGASRPWWVDHDVLVVPTSPEPPVPLGEFAPTNPDPDVGDRMGRLVDLLLAVRRDRSTGDLAAAALERRRDCPSAFSSSPRTGAKTCCCASRAQLEQARPVGAIAARRSTRDDEAALLVDDRAESGDHHDEPDDEIRDGPRERRLREIGVLRAPVAPHRAARPGAPRPFRDGAGRRHDAGRAANALATKSAAPSANTSSRSTSS